MTSDTAQVAPGQRPEDTITAPARGEPWTVLTLVRWSAEWLAGKGVPEARLSAEHLLAYVLEMDRLGLYLAFDRPLEQSELDGYRPLLRRRALHEPLQYIVGRAAFRNLDLRVDRRGLIPRPETEELVDLVLTWARARPAAVPELLDVGTGTGAIAVAARSEGAFGRVVATDVSREALSLAAENATEHGAEVEFRQGSLYEPLGADERFDVIVSNPPYISAEDMKELESQVRDWEPHGALHGGTDGLDLIEAIVDGAPNHLRPGGLLVVEIGHQQGSRVAALASETKGLGEPSIRPDLAGRDRFLVVETRAG